eukprot:TRINITY_DN14284_c0_g1_i1.p1 TRINITY_DN14284_c0_g1~~TRINITY_DN14284_c0_g1_i1.p1  ORF type:complete len:530 (+),score=175.08 TRINITY_DN14284_c0_g1_i1:59-1591(+)
MSRQPTEEALIDARSPTESTPARLSIGPSADLLASGDGELDGCDASEMRRLTAQSRGGSTSPSGGQAEARAALRSFVMMAFWFSLNHGAVMGALALASSVLGTDLGGTGSGTLYFVYTGTALLFASAVSQFFGPRRTLIGGLLLYSVYLASFLAAIGCDPRDADETQAPCAWAAFNIGSVLGGFAAGVYWTAQGAYFTLCAKAYSSARGESFSTGTSKFAGVFAFIYLAWEVVAKMASYAILEAYSEDDVSTAHAIIFSIFTVAAFVSAVGMCFVPDPPGARAPGMHGMRCDKHLLFDRALAAGRLLLTEARMQCLAPTNITFGFVSSFSTNVVNAKIIKVHLGESAVPLVSAMLSGIAAAASIPLGRLSTWTGTKLPAMMIGNVMFIAECAVYLAFPEEQLGKWPIIIMLTFAQGVARSMWEGPNRGVIADYFDGPERDAAFANIVLQMGTASTIGFYAFPPILDSRGKAPLATICLVAASVAAVTYPLSVVLDRRKRLPPPAEEPTAG